MSLRRYEKNFAPKAQGYERAKPSSIQGSELPGRTEANDVVAKAVTVVDAEAVPVEDADTRDMASRDLVGLHCAFRACRPVRRIRTNIRLTEDENVLRHFGDGAGHLVLGRKHCHLLLGRLARGIGNDVLQHQVPAQLHGRHIGVGLAHVVPRIVVEVELRLARCRMQFEPLCHRERRSVDGGQTQKCEVCVLHQLVRVEWAGTVEDVFAPRKPPGFTELLLGELGVVVAHPVGIVEDVPTENQPSQP